MAMAPVRDPDDLLCGRRHEAGKEVSRCSDSRSLVRCSSPPKTPASKVTEQPGHTTTPPAAGTAPGRSRRSRSTDGQRVRTLGPHPPHKTVEVGPDRRGSARRPPADEDYRTTPTGANRVIQSAWPATLPLRPRHTGSGLRASTGRAGRCRSGCLDGGKALVWPSKSPFLLHNSRPYRVRR